MYEHTVCKEESTGESISQDPFTNGTKDLDHTAEEDIHRSVQYEH